jgi:hypothetical protein
MKELTHIQIEQLIENSVIKASQDISHSKNLALSFKKKWNNCKSKQDRFKCLDELFITRKKLISEGKNIQLIDEGWLSDLFSNGMGGFKSTFKEWISRKVISAVMSMLGVNDPRLKQALAIGLANVNWSQDWPKFLTPVKNCKYLSDLVVDSIAEYYVDLKAREMFVGGGVFVDSMRNALVDSFKNKETIQKIQDIVEIPFCKFMTKIFGGDTVKNVVNNMMGGQEQSTGGQPQTSPA